MGVDVADGRGWAGLGVLVGVDISDGGIVPGELRSSGDETQLGESVNNDELNLQNWGAPHPLLQFQDKEGWS